MVRAPRVVGLIVCRELTFVPGAGEMSLRGMVHRLTVASWKEPTRFTVYSLLQGGRGEGRLELIFTQLSTEADIHRWSQWYAVPDPGLNVHKEIIIRDCVFPGPGRYGLSLRFDGEELTWRHLDVVLQGEPS